MSSQMKDSEIEWIGQIPSSWSLTKVKRIGQYINGYAFKPTEWSDEGLPIIRIQNLTNKFKPFNRYNGIIDEKYRINKGDYLISWSATLDVFKWDREDGYLNQHIFKAIPKTNIVDYDYFYWLANQFIKELENDKHGSTMQHVTKGTFDNFIIALPPMETQKRIAEFLRNQSLQIDSILSDTKQSIVELEKYKQSLITETVTIGLNRKVEMKESGVEYIGKVPKRWSVKNLRYLGALQNGISKSGEFFGSGYPFLSYGDVYRNIALPKKVDGLIVSSDSERENYSVIYGDVLFTRTSETIEEIGLASTCMQTIEDVVFAGFVIRFRPIENQLYPGFSKYYFRSQIHRKFFVKEMNLITRASLSQELLKKLPVLLPPLEEQLQIAEYLDVKCLHIDNLILQKQNLIKEFEEYKNSLIYEYVTGKKEVL